MKQLLTLARSAATAERTRKALRCLLGCVLHAASAGADPACDPRLPGADRDRTGH